MANQCRSCGRDLNNNYTPYSNGYPNANSTNNDRNSANLYNTRSTTATTTPTGNVSTKVMFSSVGAIKDLREKENNRNNIAKSNRRN
ncbi:probable cyclin-dependent serine/threonine-protein kinase DDB_G0292550 [Condylostylus longicornis]|uniref:probable cyclin-dependent serine/threonine-protein kinase DDB_G0292550 n=1 Tax=Condylostylus longicornis TaxID=2530218 RepID=UPI00244E0E0B|nr:probable cyclin-dependent serine/threonine-protein kinase DDB_G0292550 [Condylostylus longicornis]XP_055381029.1 probable cyclin-dependent serine/threonine-protein kinase DDB_G0292550 [Condylostylus longicornis]XP_055381030.1 probable cyclin-dependent serine/threonine-protein kinase DDB_G0292550 [Condylostylus longicornis]